MPKRMLAAAVPGLPSAAARRAVETTIARLVDLLDRLDPDPDLEPSLGWGVEFDGDQSEEVFEVEPGTPLDAEHDAAEFEHLGDASDDEPWLGAPTGAGVDQTAWSQGSSDGREINGPDDDLSTWCGPRTDADRLVLAAVESQVAALAARLRPGCRVRVRYSARYACLARPTAPSVDPQP